MATFVTFEGGDGAGKSTLIRSVIDDFKRRAVPHILTREPGGTKLAEEIRGLIVHPDGKMNALTELFLFEAARSEHVREVIRPALARGENVICDRFTHSSLAYQGAGRGLGIELVAQLNKAATGGLEPDLVVWLKLSPVAARARAAARGDQNRLDEEPNSFHENVYRAFDEISKKEASRFIVLDAAAKPEAVYAELCAHPLWKKRFA